MKKCFLGVMEGVVLAVCENSQLKAEFEQMKKASIYLGKNKLQSTSKPVEGKIVHLYDEAYFKISNYHQMAPFFMNVVSNADLWMFISSNGALTAGRRNPDNALFPYYNDDQIHDSAEITGSKSILLVEKDNKTYLWEPFSAFSSAAYTLERCIYKNIIGNKLLFEEVNRDLNISFRYAWQNCDEFGFVRKTEIINYSSDPAKINLLDGIQNVLPAGVDRRFQLEYSTLVDGYRKNELEVDCGLALYSLSSVPTDKAEPNEAWRANTIWSTGIDYAAILLSSQQLEAFRHGADVREEHDVRAARGAYFMQAEFELDAGAHNEWYLVADLNKDHSDVQNLMRFLKSGTDHSAQIAAAVAQDSEQLAMKIAQADGLQCIADDFKKFRHFSNTLYNIARGGIFENGYTVRKSDLQLFIDTANRETAAKYQSAFDKLDAEIDCSDLLKEIPSADANLERLSYQYLPLLFGRRHGDPSRPWNLFSIDLKDENGNKKLDYQGNWRDIFQNWEALALSFPKYLENMITRFLNASTADGYNPYRLMRDGFDWEVIDPADPWSHIGYWGDHQIIYLLKLLELSHKYNPGQLQLFMTKSIFTYANVPYRIKSYQEILGDPHETIDFDFELNDLISKRVAKLGVDGQYVFSNNDEIYHVNLLEKLLLAGLVKLSNFVPGAGIWMNTQRPEWNDANNALVGYGASMVTLYYLRRYFGFMIEFLDNADIEDVDISVEVLEFFENIDEGLQTFAGLLETSISDVDRKKFLDHMGEAGSDYRLGFYEKGFSARRQSIQIEKIIAFLRLGKKYIDHSIRSNERDDHLYHAYNLIDLGSSTEISIRRLYEMLEGQVAVLSSGYLSLEASISLLDALRRSVLYRADQDSYLLYPDRELPRFTDKNVIPDNIVSERAVAEKARLFGRNAIFIQDVAGQWHFKSDLRNARLLREALLELKLRSPQITDSDINATLDIYEAVCDHQSFTGRSGTFYKYEGLGSIYWHMVSKLLLAVQETFYQALEQNAPASQLNVLRDHFYVIQAGIGIHKNPALYGAFTTDAYSHTPGHSGAQQPGMTGQVKEDFLSRFGELGIIVHDGKIRFNMALLKKDEFLQTAQTFEYYDIQNQKHQLPLEPGMLAFTICQVPIVLVQAAEDKILISKNDGSEIEVKGLELDAASSKSIFARDAEIVKVQVLVREDQL